MEHFILAIKLTVLLLPLALVVPTQVKAWFSLLLTVYLGVTSCFMAVQVIEQGTLTDSLGMAGILGEVTIKVDALSAVFIMIANLIVFCAAVYGVGYLKAYPNRQALSLHAVAFNLVHVSMMLVCSLHNMLAFLIAWELMSVSAFLAMIFEYEKPEVIRAGINYLVQMHISVVFLMIGFVWVFLKTGQIDFDGLAPFMAKQPNFPLFLCFFIGFGIKAGFVPMHSWLPHAHPAAPSHVSGMMSGVIIKMGIFGILRVMGYVQSSQKEIGIFILVISLITGIYGIINAIMQRDLKRMLAFHSLENIGIIGIGLGLGMLGIGLHDYSLAFLGFAGGIFHVFNHSLFKSALFFGAGAIYQQAHTRNIEQLGGLIKKMPQTAIIFLIASLSISGLPPFNGFISEFLLYKGMIDGLNAENVSSELLLLVTIVLLVLIGGMAVFAFTKAFGLIFLGVERTTMPAHAHETNLMTRLPQYLIVVVIISIGLFPTYYLHLIAQPIHVFAPSFQPIQTHAGSVLTQLGKVSAVFLVLLAGITALRTYVVRKNGKSYGPTWGCGYLAGNSRMQYTDASFVDYFTQLAKPLIGFKTAYKPIPKNDIFPKNRSFETHSFDLIEVKLLLKPINWLIRQLDYLAFIQRGKAQSYLLYGFLFMLILFVLTVTDLI
ncbi:MAG: proton-conducting transporter membrane subunit [Spirosomataceae bacterium]